MGLEEADLVDDGIGGKGGGGGGGGGSLISCSICLEDVTDFGDRAWAKLQCSHQFHLDCIGSAFNVKGVMQCPNCRKTEKGQWLYADGHRPYPELNIDDLVSDDEVYELSYSEASMWCPYGGFAQLAAAFDEVNFPTTGYHDLVGQHAVFSEHASVSSATHICPYVAYVQPIHPPTSSANVPEGPPRYSNQWNSQSATSEIPNSYGFPTMDFHYQTHVEHPSTMPRRPARTNGDMSRSGSYVHHPFLVSQSSSTRAPNSTSSYMTHPGSAARAHERSQAFQAYFQQPSNLPAIRTPIAPGSHRSNGQVQIGQLGSSSDQTRGESSSYYQSASSGVSIPEHSIWERDPNRPFHMTGGGSIRQRHGSDRTTSSQSQYWL